MTTFKSAIALCGLSQRQAAEYLAFSLDSVKKWSSGSSAPPIGVWVMLADLWARVAEAGDFAAQQIDPESMDKTALNNVEADLAGDPLPDGPDSAAGAMAVLEAILEKNL